jgi:hypothetical protein
VERWRTRAALAAVALVAAAAVIATVVGPTSGSSSRRDKVVRRAQLAVLGQSPLVLRGSHFRARERVRLAVKGRTSRLIARAGAKGGFLAVFKDVLGCDSVTVVATGSKGSRASLNFSQLVCLERTP